jgi:uncharacterized Tic20 family protein
MDEQNQTNQPGQGQPVEAQPVTAVSKEAKQWAMFCHLAALVAYIGIPFGHVLGPLIIWLIKKDDYEYVRSQGREALNFQISMTIYCAVGALLICIGIGVFVLIGLGLVDLVFIIIAAIAASLRRLPPPTARITSTR